MQGHSLQESSASGALEVPAGCLEGLRNKPKGWCCSGTHKTTHMPRSHTGADRIRGFKKVNQQPTAVLGSGLVCNEGAVLKLGALCWCKHLCTMKSGWPTTKQPQKCEVLDCCAWTDWNIFKKSRTSGQIFEAAVQQQWLRFSETGKWLIKWLNHADAFENSAAHS